MSSIASARHAGINYAHNNSFPQKKKLCFNMLSLSVAWAVTLKDPQWMCAMILWGLNTCFRVLSACLGWFGRDIWWAMDGAGIGYFARVFKVCLGSSAQAFWTMVNWVRWPFWCSGKVGKSEWDWASGRLLCCFWNSDDSMKASGGLVGGIGIYLLV